MRRIVAGSLYVFVVVCLAAVAAWPIYRSGSFLLLVAVGSLLGAGVAALVAWRRWSGWAAAGLLAAVLLVAGVPLAVPARATGLSQFAQGLGELGAGLVFGWKDLLTVDLPVGSYRNLLVPALVVFLVGTASALLFAWRTDARASLAVPIGLAMTGFGLLFGRTDVSSPLPFGPFTLAAPVETALGLGSLAAGVLWLSWRARDARARALRVAAAAGGLRMRRSGGADLSRGMLGAGMVAVAAVIALTVPAAAASAERDVLREATGPRLELSRAVSPLVSYRTLFGDALHDTVLFTVAGAVPPDRIRLAVLDDYDGAVFRTSTADGSSAFVRMASARTPADGKPIDADFVVGDLDGIWMPSAGILAEVNFSGPRAAALSDGFYVDDELSAAVQIAGWTAGDGYHLRASEPIVPALAEATAPGGVDDGGVEAPASLRTWVEEHASGTDGAALESLVALLRDRGYLSHALTDSEDEWMADAGVDVFVPSAAGHSLARIDQLFTALLEREHDPRAEASGNYVAAIGDDEQFAVAVALIARELGFPSRVVVGARTESTDPAVTTCDAGECRADDISAWVEVLTTQGRWLSVDVTPQRTEAPSREVTALPDPTIETQVRPDEVDEVQPPKPAQEDAVASPDRPQGVDLAWLWATLRISGIVLAVAALVLGPFLLVIIAKGLRRRARRSAPEPADRIAGGWDEYLDAAADAGRRAPQTATRVEIAAGLGAEAADSLARGADEAVFSTRTTTVEDAAEFWRIVDAERSGFAVTRWQRLRAAVSLRSFIPGGLRRSPSRTERGSRADSDARRTA